MQNKLTAFLIKLVIYFALSYIMALVSIGIIVFISKDSDAADSMRNIYNIIFSTNACFISTTGWSIKKDPHPLEKKNSRGDLIYLAMVSGLLISGTFVVISSVTEFFSAEVYGIGVALTLIPCIYLAWIYIKETMEKEEIVAQHDADEYLKKAQEMIKAKGETSFSLSGSDYKL